MTAGVIPLNARTLGVGVGLAVGLGVLVVLALKNAGAIGAAIGQGAGNLAGGLVLGAGDSLGVPRTDKSECERALEEGRTWDASFACPAGTFIKRTVGAPIWEWWGGDRQAAELAAIANTAGMP